MIFRFRNSYIFLQQLCFIEIVEADAIVIFSFTSGKTLTFDYLTPGELEQIQSNFMPIGEKVRQQQETRVVDAGQ